MKIYQLLQIFVLSYTGLVVLFTLFMSYFQIRYSKSGIRANYEMGKVLEALRGKVTILLPLKILSAIFLVAWLALALPWIDTFAGTHFITHFNGDGTWTALWFGKFQDKQAGYYFMTVFVCILGVKGFWLIKHIADVLSDTSLEVSPRGLKYKKNL